jgi:hypothetical protein
MAERTCDNCGKKRNVEGGKTCENGHFICKNCVRETVGLLSGSRTQCTLCKKPLR